MEQSNIALIDADFLLFVATHNKKDEPVRTFEEVCEFADNMILDILNGTNSDKYVGCFTIGKCFRYDIYPAYKGNRKGLEKPAFFNELRDYLINKWEFISHPKLEADDIISIIARQHQDAVICSVDKDMHQIPGLHYNPKTKQFKDITVEEANQLLWEQVIKGDSTDNIKGIPGKGPKYVETLFKDVENSELHLTAFGAYVKELGIYKGVQEFYLNYNLVKLLEDKQYGFEDPIIMLLEGIDNANTKTV